MTLIQQLETKRTDAKLSGEQFADMLGIKRVTWWNIKTGGRSIGPTVLAKIIRTFPELKPQVLEYLEAYPDKQQAKAA